MELSKKDFLKRALIERRELDKEDVFGNQREISNLSDNELDILIDNLEISDNLDVAYAKIQKFGEISTGRMLEELEKLAKEGADIKRDKSIKAYGPKDISDLKFMLKRSQEEERKQSVGFDKRVN